MRWLINQQQDSAKARLVTLKPIKIVELVGKQPILLKPCEYRQSFQLNVAHFHYLYDDC